MRKAAFFDIDGTVMDVPDGMHQPSSAVIQALHQFQNEGNEIFLATSGGTSLIDGEKIRCNGPIGNDGHYIIYKYVFGDGANALEMFRMVGHGIAMGNAVEQLKQIAEENTLSVHEDGVADYIRRKLPNQ